MLTACGEGADTSETQAAARKADAKLTALDPSEKWMDKSLEEWAVEYARWYYSPTDCEGWPTDDPDGAWCDHYQPDDSPVFFFDRSAYVDGGSKIVKRTLCKVPSGKAILVPMLSWFGDNAGMDPPWPEEDIERFLGGIKGTMRELHVVADGRDTAYMRERALGPIRYSYHVPQVPNRYGCDDANEVNDVDVDPSFLTGYFVLFLPPAVGWHELEYSGVLSFMDHDFSTHVQTRFEVIEPSE